MGKRVTLPSSYEVVLPTVTGVVFIVCYQTPDILVIVVLTGDRAWRNRPERDGLLGGGGD